MYVSALCDMKTWFFSYRYVGVDMLHPASIQDITIIKKIIEMPTTSIW